jgi:protoporphyrinogen/coproporphyrinogen III oxidase
VLEPDGRVNHLAQPPEVIVVGAGISGLVCSWRLRQAGVEAVCFEETQRVGGALRSQRRNGFLVEAGANTLQATPGFVDLLREIDLEKDLLEAERGLPRFILRHGELHMLPLGPVALIRTRLLSPRAKWRLLRELRIPALRGGAEESVDSFVARRFGREIADTIAAPFVFGTFAGDPVRLSASAVLPSFVAFEQKFGGVLRGALRARRGAADGAARRLVALRRGMESLPAALAERMDGRVYLATRVQRLIRCEANGAGLEIELEGQPTPRRMAARAVVVATPPWSAAGLLATVAPQASAALAELEAPPLAVVSLECARADVAHPLRGFGFLVAPGEGVRMLGCLWPSSVFADRAPVGSVSFTVFVGGARDPGGADLGEDALVDGVRGDLGRILGIRGTAAVLAIDRYPRSIPQYTLGHSRRLQRIRAGLAAAPGVFLAGNYFAGISVGDCLDQATKTAFDVQEYLKTSVDFSRPGV